MTADLSIGARLEDLLWVALGTIGVAAILLVAAGTMLYLGARRPR